MNEMSLRDAIESMAQPVGDYRSIRLEEVHELAESFGAVREIELAALDLEIVPARYVRNVGTVGFDGQRRLLQSTVAIVGLGGLGGYVAEALARMGVGRLILIDGDRFEDHNLNRQLLSSEQNLGVEKTEVACERIARVNSAATAICRTEILNRENLPQLLEGADVVVDALDRLPTRLVLQDGAQALGIPMVHGSIGGFYGQVMTIFPDDSGLHALYGDGDDLPGQGLESELGTPAATPMVVAAWEAQEVVKLLTGRGKLLRDRLLVIDMESASSQTMDLG
jgi:molybdopterin/thiamine biosynthesis adenylyltransferase